MKPYTAPVDDYLFLMQDVFGLFEGGLAGGADLAPDLVEAILREAGRFAEDVLQPLNAVGDAHGCRYHDDGTVTAPPGFRQAYAQFVDAGWNALAAPARWGGQQMPATVATAVEEFCNSANQSFTMYTGWGLYAALMLEAGGAEHLRQTYLPRIVAGEWSGAMGLTEPHCGSDIGLLRTRAVAEGDAYRVTGTKIFNSGGEHDLAENIVHFVLARIEGAPKGSRGISLFLVPKSIPDPETGVLRPNAVRCDGIEHKMGLNGSATCTMTFDGAQGWLIGAPNQGLAIMFLLMNHTRRAIGVIATGVAEAASQRAAAYVRDRVQGRSPIPGRRSDADADPLIEQPDVRRLLLTIRATVEGSRALVLWTAWQADIAEQAAGQQPNADAQASLDLVTPVIKAYLSDITFDATVLAQQLFGGHGYVTATGVEQLVRDSRVLMVGEGANAIQAVDLVLRKLRQDDGRAMARLVSDISGCIDACPPDDTFAPLLASALADLEASTRHVQAGAVAAASAGAYAYMYLFGQVLLGYMWLRMAAAARKNLGGQDDARWRFKIATARFYFEQMLPASAVYRQRVFAESDYMMDLPADAF